LYDWVKIKHIYGNIWLRKYMNTSAFNMCNYVKFLSHGLHDSELATLFNSFDISNFKIFNDFNPELDFMIQVYGFVHK
jgi:hypothetical protein